jgi:lysophospholipase L1-like esterase
MNFIFGDEKQNYQSITKTTIYNNQQGFGIENIEHIDNNKTTVFRADIDAGMDYYIRLKVKNTFDDEQQNVSVNDVEICTEFPPKKDGFEGAFKFAAIEDNLLFTIPLEMDDVSELSISFLPERVKSKHPVIFLISDSTVKTYGIDQSPVAGWGQVIHRFFLTEISIDNRAMGGRSTKLAYNEGRLNDLLVDIKPGDYMFIQFAHNDMNKNKPERYVTVEQYKDFLNNKYIKGAKQRGAIPVCLTSMNRRTFDQETQQFVDSFPLYTKAIREVAEENNLMLLELNPKSLMFYNSLGMKNTDPLFMQLKPGEHPNYPSGLDDNTHFREAGAKQMARMVIEEINDKFPDLQPYTLDPQEVLKEVFPDTLHYWARDQVELMVRLGFIAGEKDGLFHPEAKVTVGNFIEATTHFVDETTIQKFHNNQKSNLVLDEQLDLHTATSIAADMGFQGVDGQFLLQGNQQGDMESVYTLSKGETAAYLYKLYFHKELVELEA